MMTNREAAAIIRNITPREGRQYVGLLPYRWWPENGLSYAQHAMVGVADNALSSAADRAMRSVAKDPIAVAVAPSAPRPRDSLAAYADWLEQQPDVIQSIEDGDSPSCRPNVGYHDSIRIVIFQDGVSAEVQEATIERIRGALTVTNMWVRPGSRVGNTWTINYGFDSGD